MIQAISFVCYGNICRSPFAAGVFRRRSVADGSLVGDVTSAGFHSVVGRQVPDVAREAARERGVEMDAHRSQHVGSVLQDRNPDQLLLFVMEASQRSRLIRRHGVPTSRVLVLGDFDPESIERRDIPDPYSHPRVVFERVYDRIERCVDQVAGHFDGENESVTTFPG